MKQKTAIKTRLQALPVLFVMLCTLAVPLIRVAPAHAASADCENFTANETADQYAACLAADGSTYARMNPQQQVASYLYANAMAFCLPQAIRGSANHVSSGDIFNGMDHVNVVIGTYITKTTARNGVGGDTGTINCNPTKNDSNEGKAWVQNAMSLWGFSSYTEMVCALGAHRDNNATGAACVSGTGDFIYPVSGLTVASVLAYARPIILQGLGDKVYGGKFPDLTDVQRYVLYHDSFVVACVGKDQGPVAGASPDVANHTDHQTKIMDIDTNTGLPVEKYFSWSTDSSTSIDQKLGLLSRSSGQIHLPGCEKVAAQTYNYVNAYSKWKIFSLTNSAIPQGNLGGCTTDANGICANSDDVLNCNNGSFNWLVCPIITVAAKAMNMIDGFIMGNLDVDVGPIFDQTTTKGSASNGYYTAWNAFRTIAVAMLVIAGLVMVGSQALGFEGLDAYTIRKTLPRILVAIIGISLSWQLMRLTILFFDTAGFDIRNIMYAPFAHFGGTISISAGIISTLGVTAAVWLNPASLTLILTLLVTMLVAFLTLVMREIALIMLIILAPVGIAFYVLPNTQRVWNLWRDNFLGLLLVFPAISAIIAAGHIFAAVALAGGTTTGSLTMHAIGLVARLTGHDFSQHAHHFALATAPIANQFEAAAAYGLSYTGVPIVFTTVMGHAGKLAGLISKQGQGVLGGMSKFRTSFGAKRRGNLSKQWVSKTVGKRADVVGRLSKQASNGKRSWVSRKLAGGAARAIGGYDALGGAAARQEQATKEMLQTTGNGDDTDYRALTANLKHGRYQNANGEWVYKTLGGKEVSEAAVRRAYARWGNDPFAQQAALTYEMGKATTEAEIQSVANGYHAVATQNWGQSESQAAGTWKGGAFGNQNAHLEYKNMSADKSGPGPAKMRMDKKGQMTFVDEIYERRGSYNLAQMASNTIEELKIAHTQAGAVLSSGTASASEIQAATDMQQKIAAIAQTFMHEAGYSAGIPIPGAAAGAGATAPPAGMAGAAPGGGGGRIASTPGAGHVAERVVELAELTGVDAAAPTGSYTAPVGTPAYVPAPGDPHYHAPTPNNRKQT